MRGEPEPRGLDEFERGIQYGMRVAEAQRQEFARRQAVAIATRAEARVSQERRDSFDRGYRAGLEAAAAVSPSGSKSGGYSYSDIERARAAGYQEGQRMAKSAPPTDEAALRKKMIDEMLEQCRVISESNPNMAPGVNAVRHRIKKLGK